MKTTLMLFAHPVLEKSRINSRLLKEVTGVPGIDLHDLYEEYPDFNIDADREQELLSRYDKIILQHPFYWYSCPPLVKQWIDLVLEHGWAYGSTGKALVGKEILHIVTTGGPPFAYQKDGFNRHSLNEFLIPFEQTFYLCGMNYLPPFAVQGAHRMQPADLDSLALSYRSILTSFSEGSYNHKTATGFESANAWLSGVKG